MRYRHVRQEGVQEGHQFLPAVAAGNVHDEESVVRHIVAARANRVGGLAVSMAVSMAVGLEPRSARLQFVVVEMLENS